MPSTATATASKIPSQFAPQKNFVGSGEVCQEELFPISSALEKAPDGGTKAWLVAAGGFAFCFCCLGFSNSFGTLEQYYLTHQLRDESPDKIAWIGSLSAYLQFASGMVGGPLFDRYGAKVSQFVYLKSAPSH